jgi:dihydrofolate reductase
MRTLIYTAFVSLDGVVDSPGGSTRSEAHRSGGWTYKDIEFLPEAYDIKGRETEEATALMFGRTSYEAFSPLWPDMEDFAALKELPKYVVSTTLGQDAKQMLKAVESETYANGITKFVYDVVR